MRIPVVIRDVGPGLRNKSVLKQIDLEPIRPTDDKQASAILTS